MTLVRAQVKGRSCHGVWESNPQQRWAVRGPGRVGINSISNHLIQDVVWNPSDPLNPSVWPGTLLGTDLLYCWFEVRTNSSSWCDWGHTDHCVTGTLPQMYSVFLYLASCYREFVALWVMNYLWYVQMTALYRDTNKKKLTNLNLKICGWHLKLFQAFREKVVCTLQTPLTCQQHSSNTHHRAHFGVQAVHFMCEFSQFTPYIARSHKATTHHPIANTHHRSHYTYALNNP